jgi:thiamine-monophosphate kinase
LIADAFHISEASDVGLEIALENIPLSAGGSDWLGRQGDRVSALTGLSTGGDDYALVCAVAPAAAQSFVKSVRALGVPVASVGRFMARSGRRVTVDGAAISPGMTGWRH